MANSGPNSNGIKFFIPLAQKNWLDVKHNIRAEMGRDDGTGGNGQ